MSNKFGGSTQSELNLDDGTTPIFASTLGAASLTPSTALKTGPTGLLVSTDLDVSDVTGLASDLVLKDELSFVEDDTHTNPSAGQVKIYFKTDGQLYKKDSLGNENLIEGADKVSKTGDTMTGDLTMDDANIEISTNGSQYLTVDANSSGASLGKTELRYNYLRLITSDATGNELGYIGHSPGVGMLQNVQESTSSHRFSVAGVREFQVDSDDVTIPTNNLLVEGGNVEVTGTNKTITIESGADHAVHSKSGATYTHNSGRAYNYVVDNLGVDHDLTNTAMSHDFKVGGSSKLEVTNTQARLTNSTDLLIVDANAEIIGTSGVHLEVDDGGCRHFVEADGDELTLSGGGTYTKVMDAGGITHDVTDAAMTHDFYVVTDPKLTISNGAVSILTPSLLLDDVTTRAVNFTTGITPANICAAGGSYPNLTYGAQTMNIEAAANLVGQRVVSYALNGSNIAVDYISPGGEETANSRPIGVTQTSATTGAIVPVTLSGICRIEVYTTCTPLVGAMVVCSNSTTDGRVICGSSISSNTASIGICMESPGTVAAGYMLLVHLRGQTEAY